ncbi:MAG: FdtA/QdtA family cupin domain-containing protein [Verrucomicrobiae bacterium]|nr:FdtA/QdtA family cupin domain-containing protein [Verrucomicrobiae bacterium]NNJ42506.1 FdtA/QdtA family cupin domain-containing protein [Akkermansiaceae bacterium]
MIPTWIELPSLGDERGQLSVAEVGNHAPFDIRRVYWIYETEEGVVRGKHAHVELEQLAVVVAGSCKMRLDDGNSSVEFTMDSPRRALYIGPGMWREMSEFSSDCVLLVLASEVYQESDYIRDYEKFTK